MKARPRAISDTIEIKCPRCGTINALRPVEPQPERQDEHPETGAKASVPRRAL
ncbi:Com family DNA-binding transcriptional regulator [Stappia sp.]|uniref:Com family DNA-binding transcriptional regulator n=1 Tax=Stappia sp. TaxID=1870903 RepID=UPI003C7A46DD